jgi:hypothetical protein
MAKGKVALLNMWEFKPQLYPLSLCFVRIVSYPNG